MVSPYALVYKDLQVYHQYADQNVLEVWNAHLIKHVLIKNVLILAQELVDLMPNVKL